MKNYTKEILNEISNVLKSTNQDEVKNLIDTIINSNTIITCGAGKVGMAIRGFCMRLGHFGFKAYHIGDATLPSIGIGDLLIVASGSGETQTIYDLTSIAKKNGAKVFVVTSNAESRIGLLSDATLILNAPSKTKNVDGLTSIQPMTTLNEQCLTILFDSIVLNIMDITGETHETMWNRHSNLE
jgi:6-phospho-3-hexuloisomerase